MTEQPVMERPEFPLKIFFMEENESWILEDEDDIRYNLEWFDSEDEEENASVTDKKNRPVKLKRLNYETMRNSL